MARIVDVSPAPERTTISFPGQSASGRGLTIVAARDGKRVYVGNNSGVWRSDDGGVKWKHMTRPQPIQGNMSVPGALLGLNVYDLAVAAIPDIVLAATGRDIRSPSKSGIYRSTDGARNWELVQQFPVAGQIVTAPDDPTIFFAACGSVLLKAVNSGATWSTLPVPLGGGQVWHVAVGPGPDATRRIYALGVLGGGSRIWVSTDGGANWNIDTGSVVAGSEPADAVGPSTRILSIHPSNPNILYVIGEDAAQVCNVARGDYSVGSSAGWTSLPGLVRPANTTPSGTRYVHAHVTQEGQLYIFASDRSGANVSIGDPPTVDDWVRIDGPDAHHASTQALHIDPHAIWVSPDFRLASDGGARGKIWQVNDGGVYLSTDGGVSWKNGSGFSSLSPINVAVSAVKESPPAISLHNGDNGGFFSPDGGQNWVSADYQQGDNDACFVDPRRPSLMYVFAPRGDTTGYVSQGGFHRANGQLVVYQAGRSALNAGAGTTQALVIPGPTPQLHENWNCASDATEIGYRPLILTLPGETPKAGGDFIAIRYPGGAQLVRSTALGTPPATPWVSNDWFSAAIAEGQGVKVFQQGPPLPNPIAVAVNARINIVQASGGHTAPIFYAGDTAGLWKWTNGMAAWQALVPKAGGPSAAIRFYVDPYRPDRIYLIDAAHVWRSLNGGAAWTTDNALQTALTENGAIPMSLAPSGNGTPGRGPFEALLQDFVYDPDNQNRMIAVGPAGVLATTDGAATWKTVALFSALNTRAMSTFLDTVTDAPRRNLYLATPFRGLLKLALDTDLDDVTLGIVTAKALVFEVFRTFPDPFVTSSDPANPDVTKPEGKLQKALTTAITAKASAAGHGQVLKARDPQAADFLSVFPIPFTIADVTGVRPFPVAHYNGDEVDFIASEAQAAVLFAAMELRLMVRRFVAFLGISSAQALLTALETQRTKILNAAPLIKAHQDVRGNNLPIQDLQRLPNYTRVLDFDESGPLLQVDFKGGVAPETDPNKKKSKYDFGHSLYDMVVNGNTESSQQCIDALGYGYINGALEVGGFFERPTPADPKTFRGIWIGGNYSIATIRGEIAVNDGPAQFGGTTRTFARLLALIRANAFSDSADPNGDLMWTLLNKAPTGKVHPALQAYAAGKFTYELSKPGWAQLGINDPAANFVASEAATIQAAVPGGSTKKYVVAWQNLELIRNKDGSVAVPTKDGHLLYQQSDIVDIIANTIAAYQ